MCSTEKLRFSWRHAALAMFIATFGMGNAHAADVGLSAKGGNGRIDLSWTATTNLRAVQVMRDTDVNPSGRQRLAILPGKLRNYTDNSVVNGRQYWYWIKYTDSNRNTGNSNAANAKAGDNGGTQPIAVTSVTVTPANAALSVGSTANLTASVTPSNASNKSVSWSSSNTRVATVSPSGVVTGVSAGNANVTVTTADGGRTATSAIKVLAAPDPIVNYTLTIAVSGNGSTSVAPGSHSYKSGTAVTITATPASGSVFSGWSGAATGNTNPVTVTMNGNQSLTATFTVKNDGPPTACDTLDKRLRASSVAVGGNVPVSDEYHSAVIAPRNDGTAVLAWSDTASDTIKLANLNSQDSLVSNLPALGGLEVHAGLADDNGTALAIVANDPDIYSPKYCKSSATPDKNVCGKMDLVRIDRNGTQQFRTTLTNKKNVDSDGAYFIWWYGHTARVASDGIQYGVYFRLAGSSPRGGAAGEVDIHAGDALKFVGLDGKLKSGGWDWGCSHSWSVRLAHNGTSWAAGCHGDAYPNAMKVSRFGAPTSRANDFQWLANTEPTRRALGGLVADTNGFWLNYVDDESGRLALRLVKLGDSGNSFSANVLVSGATGIDTSYPFRPYMAAYGKNQLLMGWKSGGKLVLAVADAATGAVVEGPVTTALNIDQFQEFTTAPNGDVLWAYSAGGRSVTVNRVAACKLQ